MKKGLLKVAVITMTMLFCGCNLISNFMPKDDDSLTGKIAAEKDEVDFDNAIIAEDAEVNKKITIKNLDMGGKTLTVNKTGVVLINLKNANVVAAAGIKDGDLTIEGSEILNLQILGGGSKSIHLKDSKAESVSVAKEDVRFVVEGASEVESISVDEKGAHIEVKDTAAINNVDVKVEGVKIEAEETCSVSTIKIEESVEDFKIDTKCTTDIQAEGAAAEKIVENVELPSDGKTLKAESCKDGIKITIKDATYDGVAYVHDPNNAGSLSVNGVDFYISIPTTSTWNSVSLDLDYEISTTEFIFPFVESGKDYIVTFSGQMCQKDNSNETTWIVEQVKVTAGGGISLSDYVTDTQLETLKNIKVDVEYKPSFAQDDTFYTGFTGISKMSDICNVDKLEGFYLTPNLVLGYVNWQNNSEWWGGNGFMFYDNKAYCNSRNEYGYAGESIDLFEAAAKTEVPFIWNNTYILASDWAKHDYNYCAYWVFGFRLKDYPEYSFVSPSIWSDQKTYTSDDYKSYSTESTKNLDLAAALTDGIKDVKEDGFIKTEEDLAAAFAECDSVFEILFNKIDKEDNEDNEDRAIVTAPENPATSVNEALIQIADFVKNAYSQISQREREIDYGKFNLIFDKSINVGELTFSQWFNLVIEACFEYMRSEGSLKYSDYHSVADIKKEINEELKEENCPKTLDELLAIADEYGTIKQFYLDADVNLVYSEEKLEAGETGSIGKASVETIFDFGFADVDGLLDTVLNLSGSKVKGTSPIKAAECILEGKGNASLTYEELYQSVTLEEEWIPSESLAEIAGYMTLKFAVCTSNYRGGIVTVELGLDANAKELYEASALIDTIEDITKLPEDLSAIDNIKTIKISVSNGTENTFEQEYNIADVKDLYSKIIAATL